MEKSIWINAPVAQDIELADRIITKLGGKFVETSEGPKTASHHYNARYVDMVKAKEVLKRKFPEGKLLSQDVEDDGDGWREEAEYVQQIELRLT